MKTILYLLAVALCVAEVPLEKQEGPKALLVLPHTYAATSETITSIRLAVPVEPNLSIQCGSGVIRIEYATGKVTLPEGVKLDDAAIQFWKAVAEAFPEGRRAIIGASTTIPVNLEEASKIMPPAPPTVEWVDMGPGVSLNVNRRPINIGLRSDGVVVWREAGK